MSQRRFGVELEFYAIPKVKCKCGDKCDAVKEVERLYDDYGYDEYGPGWDHIHDVLVKAIRGPKAISRDWARNMGHDGSGIEVRSPILQGPSGFAELRRVVKLIVENGGDTGYEDGLHVHHDAPEFVGNKENTARLIKSWMENQDNIWAFIDEDRRYSDWCRPWNENKLNAFLNPPAQIMARYADNQYYQRQYADGANWYAGDHGDLNIDSLTHHGSIEIRLHEGTLDIDKIEPWVRFGQKFIDEVAKRKEPLEKCPDPAVLLKRVKCPKGAAAKLAARAGVAA